MPARPARLLVALILGWSLACAGPPVDTDQTPEPDPRPDPAPNAAECATFEGVSLPLEGGVITRCEAGLVHLDHEDPAKTRWLYSKAYEGAGWRLSDPIRGAPTVTRDGARLVFEAKDADVIIKRL